ncbi:ribosomal protein S16 [Nautilia profundicola AmH]|uniref:Small ribosomal subunit protein bS16 n=1 Tax=Nautilia profundicola (strain ATCC BAA-1463 / DSM 18972 / AmH) TaxID=598659 RepID=RS16_NAUPA|nr:MULTISPECIES: 30S ribosomal protein S16 [Nautilia]B9L6B5.1 RecName: Full=Small ribosomal subunit protein bS16; AltName: Full=30S ribosomal protein S16 [Nautilia profundicola AmH]ACM92400.1 ribosomal protein S16 [Nautilia profundicola AmH]AZV47190.1 30S ribosomal protein S16 [Nautilia sp. PV-1]
MVKVRLARFGRKKRPFYRIVVTDSRKRRDSGWIESIGYYNPMTEPATVKMDLDRLNYWLGVGAQMSERVTKLKKIAEENNA